MKNPERIDKNLRKQAENFNWKNIKFPFRLSDIDKFEKNNKIYVNVFGYDEGENVYPRHVAKNEGAIDLLLISDGEKSHYCLIKNFNKLMTVETGKSRHSVY